MWSILIYLRLYLLHDNLKPKKMKKTWKLFGTVFFFYTPYHNLLIIHQPIITFWGGERIKYENISELGLSVLPHPPCSAVWWTRVCTDGKRCLENGHVCQNQWHRVFLVSSRTTWHFHIRASLYFAHIRVSVNCLLSVKVELKTAIIGRQLARRSILGSWSRGYFIPNVAVPSLAVSFFFCPPVSLFSLPVTPVVFARTIG